MFIFIKPVVLRRFDCCRRRRCLNSLIIICARGMGPSCKVRNFLGVFRPRRTLGPVPHTESNAPKLFKMVNTWRKIVDVWAALRPRLTHSWRLKVLQCKMKIYYNSFDGSFLYLHFLVSIDGFVVVYVILSPPILANQIAVCVEALMSSLPPLWVTSFNLSAFRAL